MTREEALAVIKELKNQRQRMYNILLPLVSLQTGCLVRNIQDTLKTLNIEIKELEEFLL